MRQRGKLSSNVVVVAVVTAMLLPEAVVWGADARDVDELRSEIRQLQGQVQSLRSALGEMSELEQQRSAAVAKSLGGAQGTSEPTPVAPVASTEIDASARQASPAEVSSARADRPARPARHRRHKHSKSRSKPSRVSSPDR